MEFQKNLAEIKEQRQSEKAEQKADDSTIKVEINNLLFMFMPPRTTIEEVDDFALAILQTIQAAWNRQ